jgi:hypothetical protein
VLIKRAFAPPRALRAVIERLQGGPAVYDGARSNQRDPPASSRTWRCAWQDIGSADSTSTTPVPT